MWYVGRRDSDTDGEIFFFSLDDGENEGEKLVNDDYLCKIIQSAGPTHIYIYICVCVCIYQQNKNE